MASAHTSTSLESRLDFLSQPKVNFLKFKDRKSIYWVDKIPEKTNGTTVPAVTRRQDELARPKQIHKNERMSPTRQVSQWALHAVPSARLESLALAKSPSKEWKSDRPVHTVVSNGAKTTSPSPRTVQLATPKMRSLAWMRIAEVVDQSTGDRPSVTDSTRELTSKTELLAAPKTEHPEYVHHKTVQWPVPESAKNYVASDRVCQLAKHKMKKSIFEGYDPYRIHEGAKQAEPSPRIQELCAPLPRKIRQKKV